MSVQKVRDELSRLGSPERASSSLRYFKTGKGQYGEGDKFLGLNAREMHAASKKYQTINVSDAEKLLKSDVHEHRAVALLILVRKYKKGDDGIKKDIFRTYVKNIKHINNWDLVDCSAHHITGAYLEDKDKDPLFKWAKSKNIWARRIAVLSTFNYIRKDKFGDTLKVARMLLNDEHDLIHKAVGWMLREIGKRDINVEEKFLKEHYKKMPRTMLRYAIERFPEKKRLSYLKGEIK